MNDSKANLLPEARLTTLSMHISDMNFDNLESLCDIWQCEMVESETAESISIFGSMTS